jgi:hypothetical protein
VDIYLIQQLWTDNSENNVSDAYGYLPLGYVFTRKEAERWVNNSSMVAHEDCWAITTPLSRISWIRIEHLKRKRSNN